MQTGRNIWTLFVTVLGLSFVVFYTNLTFLTTEQEEENNTCQKYPKNFEPSFINRSKTELPYKTLLGGVAVWKTKEFEQVNGWSNLFVNWGGEDDDLSYRTIANKLSIFRFRNSVARYTMLKHRRTPVNTARHKQLKDSYTRYKIDGLSSLVYQSHRVQRYQLFTMVSINT